MINQPLAIRLILLFAAAAAAVFAAAELLNILARAVLGRGFAGFDDLAGLVFRWIIMLAAPAAFIARDPGLFALSTDWRAPAWQRVLAGLATSIGALVCAIMAFGSVKHVQALIASDLTMMAFGWPLWLAYLPFAGGFALASVALAWFAIARFSARIVRSGSQS